MAHAGRAHQRAAVHHVRGPAQGRRRSRSSTRKTYIKPWFIQQMKELVELEEEILKYKGEALPDELLIQAKKDGFADTYLAKLLGVPRSEIREQRTALGVVEAWDAVPVSGVENAAYYYSTYNAPDSVPVQPTARRSWCWAAAPTASARASSSTIAASTPPSPCATRATRSIMVNCNPETVSTDYDTSDKLYFEPLTVEDVLSIYEKEKPEGVIVQFGGQTPLNIAAELAAAGVQDPRHLARDHRPGRGPRPLPQDDATSWASRMPESGMASNLEEALAIAARIGYPLMVRPSYVLGGRGMEVVHDEEMLQQYVDGGGGRHARAARSSSTSSWRTPSRPRPTPSPTARTPSCPAVMEHIELAGIHSGDSACVIPPVSIPPKHIETIEEYTRRIAIELKVVGLMNIQYAICQGHGLRAGGQPARLAHRAAGLEGLQHPDGAHRHAAHAGQEARAT